MNAPDQPDRKGLDALTERLAGHRIAGGCDSCNAYQTVAEVDGIYVVKVSHDDWCPRYKAMRRRPKRGRRSR